MVEQIINKAVNTPPTPDTSFVDHLIKFWWVYLIFIVLLLAGVLLLLWKVFNWIKEKKNPLISIFKEKKNLAKQHRSLFYYNSYFNPNKNTKIVCEYLENDRIERNIIGYYYGHYYSSEGNLYVMFARRNVKHMLFFPSLKLLMLNTKEISTIELRKGTKTETIDINVPISYCLFLEDEIKLRGIKSIDSIDEDTLFYVPVHQTYQGGTNDLRNYALNSIESVAITHQYMNSLNYFINANKKIVEFNPFIKAKIKLGDNTNNYEGDEER